MDRDLILRAQAGDQRAFDALALADYPRLYKVAHGILRDPSHAEDATQQAYLDIWRNIQRLRDPAKFEPWSYRLLVHACYAEARRTPKWIAQSEVAPRHEPRAADAYASIIDRDELEQGFRHVSVDQRAVIVLHYLLDMTLEQVADVLGLRPGTVNSRLSRGMDAMRKAMGPEYADQPRTEIRRGDVA
jgi:RNA polymerase sigma-70 factor (ECF subfamily)